MKALIFLFGWLACVAFAQEPAFPQRGPLEITVLFPAGSSADVTARMLADGMSKHLGQRVLVVNRPGAGGAIGLVGGGRGGRSCRSTTTTMSAPSTRGMAQVSCRKQSGS